MNPSLYEQILALRAIRDAPRRGWLFEQAIREVLPWDVRPPLSINAEAEQLDAFFEWNSWLFLVEAKAKEGQITRGSHDWEDFELKLRRRHGACIGLFCSLYPVPSALFDAATDLIKNNITTVILAGDFWDELASETLPLQDVLHHAVLNARARLIAVPPRLSDIRRWTYDKQQVSIKLERACGSYSALFLRRHKLPHHSELYIRRGIDHDIVQMAELLCPSRLAVLSKTRISKDKSYETERTLPAQLCLFRDSSGSGKTTISVEIAMTRSPYLGIATAAIENDIDKVGEFLSAVGADYGLNELRAVNQPLLLAIASLDEARSVAGKTSQVLSLLRFLDDLNVLAAARNLIAFPIAFVFTVREDYWERWRTLFEGRTAVVSRKRFSQFSAPEFDQALSRYSAVYNYSLSLRATEESIRVLSLPFNLQVFSEAHEHHGELQSGEVLDEMVLGLYFARKREDILKHRIPGLTGASFMAVTSSVAMAMLTRKVNRLAVKDLLESIRQAVPIVRGQEDEIGRALLSEQIIARDSEGATDVRFRHSRFIEYLVAYFVALNISRDPSIDNMMRLTDTIFESAIVSMYRVHEFIKFIVAREFPDELNSILNYYAGSHRYMAANLQRLRTDIAHGEQTNRSDLDLIIKSSGSSSPDVIWDGFFVLAAKSNGQSSSQVVDAFEVAWKMNEGREDRWKVLQKVAERGLIFTEAVFSRALSSQSAKEWEIFRFFSEKCQQGKPLKSRMKAPSGCIGLGRTLVKTEGGGPGGPRGPRSTLQASTPT
jgi:hypothetical protein